MCNPESDLNDKSHFKSSKRYEDSIRPMLIEKVKSTETGALDEEFWTDIQNVDLPARQASAVSGKSGAERMTLLWESEDSSRSLSFVGKRQPKAGRVDKERVIENTNTNGRFEQEWTPKMQEEEEAPSMNSRSHAEKLTFSQTSERGTKTPSSGEIKHDVTKTLSKDNKAAEQRIYKQEQGEKLNSLRDAVKSPVSATPDRGTKTSANGCFKHDLTNILSNDNAVKRSISKEAKRAVVESSSSSHSMQHLQTGMIFPTDGEFTLEKHVTRRKLGSDSIQVQAHFTPVSQRMKHSPISVFAKISWPFLTLIRKAMADKQRNTIKGENSMFDWVFKYNVNKDIPKIKSEIKILFGPRFIEFRGSNLKKKISDFLGNQTGGASFMIHVWVLPRHTKR